MEKSMNMKWELGYIGVCGASDFPKWGVLFLGVPVISTIVCGSPRWGSSTLWKLHQIAVQALPYNSIQNTGFHFIFHLTFHYGGIFPVSSLYKP